jgi:hypothetical protein
MPRPSVSLACAGALALGAARAAETVQIDVAALLNARPVTVVAGGRLVAWTEGLDGDYSGEATLAAGRLMGDAVPKALPGDGRFPATAAHPEVVLHFADEDASGRQVRRSLGADSFSFAVPAGRYARLSLFCMSANGPSALAVRLQYADGNASRTVTVPDWYNELPAGDPDRYYLASDLAKWDKANRKLEENHHYLFGLELRPETGRTLARVAVAKSAPGALTFWGATGVREAAAALRPSRPAARAAVLRGAFDCLGRPAAPGRAATEGSRRPAGRSPGGNAIP